MSEGIVTLIIKAANQSVPDHRMDCNTEWSVLHLKDHLSAEHPSKPRVDEQRLIYSGQLLLDNILLRNILRYPSENNSYTIHLVCSAPRNPTNTSPQHSQSADQRRSSNTPVSSSSSSSAQTPTEATTNQSMTDQQQEAAPLNTESTDGVRRRNVVTSGGVPAPTQQTIDASAYPSMVANAFQASGDPMQQMATMQQMYAHYMAYMQYMQMGGGMAGFAWPQQMVQLPSVPNPATSTATATTTTTATVDPAEQPQEQNVPADAQQQQQQQPQQIRMNAQGGEVEDDDDDEGMGRDWLDWIYVLSRMVVLLSIVYFYSTFYKFMIVVCVAMLLYLYQAGWFRPARRVEQPREGNDNENDNIQDDRNNNINNNNNNNEVPAELRNPGEEEPGADDNQEENGNENQVPNDGTDRVVEEIPVRPSLLALSWTFLTSLFTSLIPEPPQVV